MRMRFVPSHVPSETRADMHGTLYTWVRCVSCTFRARPCAGTQEPAFHFGSQGGYQYGGGYYPPPQQARRGLCPSRACTLPSSAGQAAWCRVAWRPVVQSWGPSTPQHPAHASSSLPVGMPVLLILQVCLL